MRAAMNADKDLNIFGAIIAILEGGTISGSNAAAKKIVDVCHKEMQRQLRILDKAVAAVNSATEQKDKP